MLLGIENRGTDATGFVASTFDAETILDKKDIQASDFVKSRKRLPKGTQTVLLHTRFATQGPPEVWANNHPVFSGSVFTVHNGTIRNDTTLFKKYDLDRVGTVDSEIIPALLYKYGFEEADKAFAEMTGGFATASIDPIRYPGQVVLAANGNWPLVLLESKNFVVWASTLRAIKDAWGAVLGTPPGDKSFEEFGAGDMAIINGEEVDRRPEGFKPASSWTSSNWKQGTSYSWNHGTEDDPWDTEDDGPWWGERIDQYAKGVTGKTYPTNPPRTILNLKDVVRKVRSDGQGICITYRNRLNFGEFLKAKGNDKWFYCPHCEDTVADVQVLHGSLDFGDICLDCYAIGKAAKAAEEQTLTIDEYLDTLDMDDDVYKKLTSFADVQTYIHNQAIFKVAADTGVKRTTIDFLLHRADLGFLDKDSTVTDLYADLADRYMDAYALIWSEYHAEAEKEQKKEKEGRYTTLWVSCAKGVHKKDEDCEACKAVEASTEDDSEVGVQVFAEEEKKPVINLDKCLVCKRKSRVILGRSGAWCKKHFALCSEANCRNKNTVGRTKDGKRWCHTHSRRRKGFIADGDSSARKLLTQELERVAAY